MEVDNSCLLCSPRTAGFRCGRSSFHRFQICICKTDLAACSWSVGLCLFCFSSAFFRPGSHQFGKDAQDLVWGDTMADQVLYSWHRSYFCRTCLYLDANPALFHRGYPAFSINSSVLVV